MARTLDKEAQESHRQSEDERCCTVFADDPNVFSVNEILDIRAVKNEIEYLVAWTGYPAENNQWVSEQNITPDLKRAFSRVNKAKVIKSLKGQQAQRMRHKNGEIENSTTSSSTIKKENESFEEKLVRSKLSLWTAMKKELNDGKDTPKSATLPDIDHFETVYKEYRIN